MTIEYQYSPEKFVRYILPSNGFMRASLAIVAQAPLVAGALLAKSAKTGNFILAYQLPGDDVRLLGYLPLDALQLHK
jgi:hypothetical protein